MAVFGIVLYVFGMLLAVVGGIMILIAAFRTSVLWGLGSLFLAPVNLIFICTHWYEAKKGFLLSILGTIIGVAGIFTGMAGGGGTFLKSLQVATSNGQPVPAFNMNSVRQKATQRRADPAPDAGTPEALIGRSLRNVRDELGVPKGEMQFDQETHWFYGDFTLVSKDGVTVTGILHNDLGEQ